MVVIGIEAHLERPCRVHNVGIILSWRSARWWWWWWWPPPINNQVYQDTSSFYC